LNTPCAGNAEALEDLIRGQPRAARWQMGALRWTALTPRDEPLIHVRHSPPRPAAAARARRHRAAARLQEHLQPRAAAGRLARARPGVHDLLDSDDTRVMLDALEALGCGMRAPGQHRCCVVTGLGGRCRCTRRAVPGQRRHRHAAAHRRAGLLAATQGGRFEVSGVPRMHERPIGDLVDALRPLGCTIDYLGSPATRRCAWGTGRPRLRT
jgi:hypothetical protein